MIRIYFCRESYSEKKYIIDTIFTDFICIDYEINILEEQSGIIISLPNGATLRFNDFFFDKFNGNYLVESALPDVRLIKNRFTNGLDIPLLYGRNNIDVSEKTIVTDMDLFSSSFFMLSRMEEAIINERDAHGRFSGKASTAYKHRFLERPIVDEYSEVLWNMISFLDNTLKRELPSPSNFITCDVDWPFEPTRQSLALTLRAFLGDIFRKKNIPIALNKLKQYCFYKLGVRQEDHFREAINWIMDLNENVGNKVAFYFIPIYTSKFDSNFSFDSQPMRELFISISERGHEIGIHPGYNTFNSSDRFRKSVDKIKKIIKEEQIHQSCLGGRMHYLRWDVMTTPQLWEKNGLDYDSTLSFADVSGFRCGTSREYSMYDLVSRRKMKLRQRPLINMECTVLDSQYESHGYTIEALERFNYFKAMSYRYNGVYTLLWHNSHFNNPKDKEFYNKLIS